jgi:hypothetical protein
VVSGKFNDRDKMKLNPHWARSASAQFISLTEEALHACHYRMEPQMTGPIVKEERVEPIHIAVLLYPVSNHNTKSPANCLCHAYVSGVALSEHIVRAIAQAVSRCIPTAAARVRARGRSYRLCGGQRGTRACFFRVLRLSLPYFIPPLAPQSPSSIIWGWYGRPIVAAVPCGLSLTPLRIIEK